MSIQAVNKMHKEDYETIMNALVSAKNVLLAPGNSAGSALVRINAAIGVLFALGYDPQTGK